LGGIAAVNAGGSLRIKYGAMENLVLGLEAVTAEGKIINYGGKMIKNVAGYDLRKLFIGSWGTLGVITKITLKIFPLPEKALSLTYYTEDYQVFLNYIWAVQEKDVQLTGFDFGVKDDQYYMHLLISGQNEAVIRQAEILTKLFKELNLSEKLQPVEEKEDPYLNSGKGFYQKYFSQNETKFIIKSSLLFSHIPNWLKTIKIIQGRENLSLSGFRSGGIFYTFFSGDDISLDTMEEISLFLTECLPDGIHTAYDLNMKKTREEGNIFNQGINKDIKESLDPDQLFLPGRNPGLFL
ncbi:MAG: FAD-binding oxidoreductase, partial [Dehalobacterium sp.]